MNQANFSLYDLIVDVIPGMVAISLIVSLLPEGHRLIETISNTSILNGILLIGLAYVVGQLLQGIASPIDLYIAKRRGNAYPFENELNSTTDTSSEDEKSIAERFQLEANEFFYGDFSNTDLFFLTQSRLLTDNIGRIRRFQVLYTFFRGLWIIFALGSVLHIIALLSSKYGIYNPILNQYESIVLIVILSISSVISYRRRIKMHKVMARTMITDFYASVVCEHDSETCLSNKD